MTDGDLIGGPATSASYEGKRTLPATPRRAAGTDDTDGTGGTDDGGVSSVARRPARCCLVQARTHPVAAGHALTLLASRIGEKHVHGGDVRVVDHQTRLTRTDDIRCSACGTGDHR
ncbi:hypothetical protein BL253_35505 [Pseudofrankia asymbiotica]|uniref:Uncharacterized protein n=1 Tax=Pseudofrankia asymbiotica TaxID=1834516 RepID=A0A1V2I049_9ACTN|nr:hypothetical protein BL253_35505 [Pseudofrankia asymbiotica]